MNIEAAHQEHVKAIESVLNAADTLEEVVQKIIEALESGAKVLWMGNGGSAAEAQHMAAELMVRYVINRQPLASIALTTDSSLLTAHSNDFEFETIFSRQIDALARPGDVVIGISTSGTSANILKGMEVAQEKGCLTIALIGSKDSPLLKTADYCFPIHSKQTARIQEAHTFLNHLICEGLDAHFSG
ncbi:D-sedoheptulose-7-phosphate isomerase [Hydrogenovibrio kuenenii]|uniref:D-sedoheptulose-7-phosphate isomerase n=1 Tax=Hydrogenovibrio kuenenii TaxID=63658 RepID=UPI000466EF5B|nr:SIS domain-containing protein [Hydrogenovibrio kuenenii]